MKRIHFFTLLCFCTVLSCTRNTNTDKYQNKRYNITDVKDSVREIVRDDVMIGSTARLYLINNYLIIHDAKSPDLLIHLFNRNNYEYVTSAIPMGQGPGEVTLMGFIGVNENKNEIYVADNGKLRLFSYPVDSILNNPLYIPETKKKFNNVQFPSKYVFINDTLSFARIIEPTGNVGHNEAAAKWNMQTGEVSKMKYTHPKVGKKRICIAVSMDHQMFVECYHNHDLMTILNVNGDLKCNVYGNNWKNGTVVQIYHFGGVVFQRDKIIASYAGGNMRSEERFPNKLLIFNVNGDYIKTLDIGYRITDFCYDKQNDRLIFAFDDMIQFGYLEMNNLLD